MRVLYADGTIGHNPKELYLKPTGGTLTSLTIIPRLLAKKGHDVYVQSEYKQDEMVDGVHYVKPGQAIPRWDVAVFNRNFLPRVAVEYSRKVGAKNIWWLHDLTDARYLDDDTYTLVDKIVGMSQYNIDTYSDYYNIPKERFELISNGVDLQVYYPGNYEKRNPNLYIVASAPHRGFDAIETIYWELRKKNPNLDFRVYSNQSLHHTNNTDIHLKTLRRFKEIGVRVFDPVIQPELANIMREAWCLLMPYKVPETCCNLLLQARACGLPVLSSAIGANAEWITHEQTGLLSKWPPYDYFNWLQDCARQAVRLYEDRDLHKRISEQGQNDIPTWSLIAFKWDQLLHSITGDNQ